ncbi:MAG: salicylate hydroxylase [Candidatus Azotimanducaceae bacterium]
MSKHVIIVGGGIGGLCAALCLARYNISSEVLEQASEIAEVGAGIQLSPNCTRVLHGLGLENALSKNAVMPESIKIRSWKNGAILESTVLGAEIQQVIGFPYYHIHRADLIALLIDAVLAEPLISLHTGECVDSFSQDLSINGPRNVSVVTQKATYKGDILIGADGLHSLVRSQLFGDKKPAFTGNVAWRFLVPADKLTDKPELSAQAWWGPGKHLVHYYVKGAKFINCVCVVEKQFAELESWNQRGDAIELKRAFSDWHNEIQQLLNNMDDKSCFKTALYDRDPLKNWTKGSVTLLGDACHPTLPTLAQGAAMAIEDAAAIAYCIDGASDNIEAALAQYQFLRMERTAKLQRWARRNVKIFHLEGPAAWLRDKSMFLGPAKKILKEVYAFNVYSDCVNKSRI